MAEDGYEEGNPLITGRGNDDDDEDRDGNMTQFQPGSDQLAGLQRKVIRLKLLRLINLPSTDEEMKKPFSIEGASGRHVLSADRL